MSERKVSSANPYRSPMASGVPPTKRDSLAKTASRVRWVSFGPTALVLLYVLAGIFVGGTIVFEFNFLPIAVFVLLVSLRLPVVSANATIAVSLAACVFYAARALIAANDSFPSYGVVILTLFAIAYAGLARLAFRAVMHYLHCRNAPYRIFDEFGDRP